MTTLAHHLQDVLAVVVIVLALAGIAIALLSIAWESIKEVRRWHERLEDDQ